MLSLGAEAVAVEPDGRGAPNPSLQGRKWPCQAGVNGGRGRFRQETGLLVHSPLGYHPREQRVQSHLEETRSQRERLDEVLRRHGAEPHEHVDQSMQAIVREAEKWARMVQDPDLRDAGLIASAQRVEHYEIAVYGTLATWAKHLKATFARANICNSGKTDGGSAVFAFPRRLPLIPWKDGFTG
jgi:hypothetical protein